MWKRVPMLVFLAVSCAAFFPSLALASGSLSFTPASGSYHVDDEIAFKVVLDSTEPLSGTEGKVVFDPLAFDVSIAGANEDFSWVQKPTAVAGKGEVDFSALLPKNASATKYELFTLTAKAKRVGHQVFHFDSAATVSADGTGGNVLGREDDAAFDVTPNGDTNDVNGGEGAVLGATTDSSVDISSDSIIDPSKWYSLVSSSVNLNVPLGVKRIRVGITGKPWDSGYRSLDITAATSSATSTLLVRPIDKLDEGVWYYHVTPEGEGATSTHFRIAIDRTAPTFGATKIRERTDMTDPRITIVWDATDTVSGISEVTAAWDGESSTAVAPAGGVVVLVAPSIGEHKIKLTATDAAGNHSELELPMTVTSLVAPVITQVGGSKEAQPLKFTFKGLPGASLSIDFFGNKIEHKDTVVLDSAGSGTWVLDEHLLPAPYEIAVSESTQNGGKSTEVRADVAVEWTVIGFLGRNLAMTIAALAASLIAGFFVVRFTYRRTKTIASDVKTLALPAPASDSNGRLAPARLQVLAPVQITRGVAPAGRSAVLSGDVVDLRRSK